jgi:uncharacterized protein (TIGR03437 family)
MPRRALAYLMLLTSTAAAAAGAPTSLLGFNYSEWLGAATQMAADTSGALYLLGSCPASSESPSCVSKLSADGKTILWQNALGFQTKTMAVSPSGDVFVIPVNLPSDTSIYVAKLRAAGSGVIWKAAAGFLPPANTVVTPVLAADSQGRAYVAAVSGTTVVDNAGAWVTTVVRLNAAGSAIDYSAIITGSATSIAADGSGAVVVAGSVVQSCFVSRVAANGSVDYYTPLAGNAVPALALDASGNAVIVGSQGLNRGWLQRLNSRGIVTVSTSIVTAGAGLSPLGLDAAGNAYVLGFTAPPQLPPLRNSIAPCLPAHQPPGTFAGTAPVLTVVAPDGSTPQVTYVPEAAYASPANGDGATLLLAVGPDSRVFVATGPATGFEPTQQGPLPPAAPPGQTILLQLSPQSTAQTTPLVCAVNSATYLPWAVAPGELVSLVGSGLGPVEGAQTQASPQSPFPVQASGVQVTFDGTPAPLLWVQDSQINAVVPWTLKPGTNTRICVSSGGTRTNCLTWPVEQTAPGVFLVDGVHAAALNQDGSINSAANPAAPGSIVSVFATGLGPIDPPPTDGSVLGIQLPNNVLQAGVVAERVTVSRTGAPNGYLTAPVAVSYAGPAPYLVAGASQINFQIPTPDSPVPDPDGYYLALPSMLSPAFAIYVAGHK